MRKLHKQAVRTFNKLMDKHTHENIDIAKIDAGFDSGEFSSQFHANLQMASYYQLLEIVSKAYGILTTELEWAVNYEGQEYIYNLMKAGENNAN